MKDPRVAKLADLLVNYSVKVQPEEWVMITGNMVAEPLIAEVLRCARGWRKADCDHDI